MLIAIASALIAAQAVQATPPARYALDLAVVHEGVTTLSARTIIVEDGNANLSVNDSERHFEMNANLSPVQGDGDEQQLSLTVDIVDGDSQPQEPALILNRGGTARFEIGNTDADGKVTEGLSLTATPLD